MAFTIIVTFEFVNSEELNKALPLLLAHGERCLQNEPGTLQFDFSRVRNDDTKLFVYEVYEDKNAFKAHAEGSSLKKLDADIQKLAIDFEMTQIYGNRVN
jgi:quinol monooxygenase YgiN